MIATYKIIIYTIMHFFLIPKLYYLKMFKDYPFRKNYMHKIAVKWGKKIFKILSAEVEVIGKENIPDKPVVVISNHQHALDIPLLMAYLGNQPSFIAKKELKKIPFFSTWMSNIGCIFLNRKSAREALISFKEGAKQIQKGQSVIIFPEGTRSNDLLPFHKGSFKLPVMAGVQILPVTIVGTEHIDSKKHDKNKITLIIDKPLDTSSLDREGKNGIHLKVREIIQDNMEKYKKII